MKIKDRISNYLFNQLEKRVVLEDIYSRTLRYGSYFVNDDTVLESSDVYELLQDISNQVMLADWVVEDELGNEWTTDCAISVLRNPNNYLISGEFIKLMTNIYLFEGEVYPLLDGDQLHLVANVHTELDDRLVEHFTCGGTIIPGYIIRHIKNIGTSHLRGVGLRQLGMSTLVGVMNAEKVLTDKYKKGGFLAFLLKLDAHINPSNTAQSKRMKAILNKLEEIDESRSVKLIPLGKGYAIEGLESPVKDEQILSYLNIYKKDLGKFLGINVETYQSLIKSDLDKAMIYLHNKAVRPILKNFEDHLSLLFWSKFQEAF